MDYYREANYPQGGHEGRDLYDYYDNDYDIDNNNDKFSDVDNNNDKQTTHNLSPLPPVMPPKGAAVANIITTSSGAFSKNEQHRETTSLQEQMERRLTRMTMSIGVGNCAVAGYCFSNYVLGENYGSSEDCTFTADGISGPLVFTHFDIHTHSTCGYDDLTIGGTKYCVDTAPTGLFVTAGEQMTFHTDGYSSTEQRPGFRACIVPIVRVLVEKGAHADLPKGRRRRAD